MDDRHSREPYIHEIEEIGGVKIYLVDGAYIRKHMWPNFTTEAHGFDSESRRFIPKNEFWIDIGHDPSEYPFYLDRLFEEAYQRSRLVPEKKAEAMATKIEKMERHRASMERGEYKKTIDVNRKLLQKIQTDYQEEPLELMLVYGKSVRDHIEPLWHHGGHDLVYPKFTPPNTAWIDDTTSSKEWVFFTVHELGERKDMKISGGNKGLGENYKTAHAKALRDERRSRHDEEYLTKRLEELGITCF